MTRLLGALGGITIGIIVCALIRGISNIGLTIYPFDTLFMQLSPGIIAGLILGLIFPRFFKYGLYIFMMIPGGGGS